MNRRMAQKQIVLIKACFYDTLVNNLRIRSSCFVFFLIQKSSYIT